MTKQELVKKEENNMIEVVDQSGVEKAIATIIEKNNSLLADNVVIDRIKNSAGFYVANKPELMALGRAPKLQMLYGILKEAMVGCEAGTDYDIIPFKGKPTVCRKKEGWFKIINLIKPAPIIRFTTNVIFDGDEYEFNPVTEELKHTPKSNSDKYEDIVGAYAYIKFADGFEKLVFMRKKDLDTIKKISPSGNTAFSPWTTMPIKMVKTKVTKELAKELFTLFSGNINSTLAAAANSDEIAVTNVDFKGNIVNDESIYNEDESVVLDAEVIEEQEETDVDINNL